MRVIFLSFDNIFIIRSHQFYHSGWNIQMHLVHKFHEEKHLLFLLLSNVVHTNITMGEYEIKKETEFEDTKTDTEEALEDAGEGLEDAGDKVKAGAKAFGKKVADPDKDLESEYQKEKIEEKMD